MVAIGKDVEERFPKEVAKHQMTIIGDHGVNRHLRFQRPGSYCMGFDLITWPGHLCFTGDMGTYVFSRVQDMFAFFRGDKPNPSYWSEKVLATDRNGGIEEFSIDQFRAAVKRRLDDAEVSEAVRRAVDEEVLSGLERNDERGALERALHFEHGSGFRFEDVSELATREYTYRFLWCCHALVWAVAQYDAAKGAQREKAELVNPG